MASVLSQGRSSWTTFKPFRNDHEKRDFVACGAAAGVAAAFGAPVGGALFALEEGATHWNDFLTWRTFVAAMVSKFTLNLVLSGIYGTWGVLDTPASIAFGSFRDQDKAYTVQEIPLFIVLGAVGGIVGAAFNEINKRLTIWRKRHIAPFRFRNVAEVLLVAATVASISFVVPYANDQLCVSRTEYNDTHEPMKLLPAAQFYCEDGQLNDYVSPRSVHAFRTPGVSWAGKTVFGRP